MALAAATPVNCLVLIFFSPSLPSVQSTLAPPGFAHAARSAPAAPLSLLSVQGFMGRLAGARLSSSPGRDWHGPHVTP
jgi:hypothetical protein